MAMLRGRKPRPERGSAGWSRIGVITLFALAAGVLSGSPATGEGASVLATQLVGTDLIVTVLRPSAEGPAELRLLDEGGQILAEEGIQPGGPLPTDVVFSGALSDLPASGFQYWLEVVDSGSGGSLASHPFRTTLECVRVAENRICRWATLDKVVADSLLVDQALAEALGVHESLGSADLLEDVLRARPDLEGGILSLAMMLAPPRAGAPDPSGCICRWMSAEYFDPGELSGGQFTKTSPLTGEPLTQIGYYYGPGGYFHVEAQTRQGLVESHPKTEGYRGLTRLSLDIACWETTGTVVDTVVFGGDREPLTIFIPTINACTTPCAPETTVEAWAIGRLDVRARPVGEDDEDTWAFSTASATARVVPSSGAPPETLFEQDWAICAGEPSSGCFDDDQLVEAVGTSGPSLPTWSGGVTASIENRGSIQASAGEGGNFWAYARASVFLKLELSGASRCTVAPNATLCTGRCGDLGGDIGEPLIEPWR